MKTIRKIVQIDEDLCNGCGQCLPNCAEGAISIVNGKAKLKEDKLCDGLGACLGNCPMDAIRIIEREAEDFDETAAHAEMAAMKAATAKPVLGCGCPSSNLMTFTIPAAPTAGTSPGPSQLGHWPVKLRLVPQDAPFLRGAEVILTADCVPVALPDFNARLGGKAVMIACPKFDDPAPYLHKLVEIFRHAGLKKIQILRMEVPCCSGLSALVRQAMDIAGAKFPVEDIVVTRTGSVKPAEVLSIL